MSRERAIRRVRAAALAAAAAGVALCLVGLLAGARRLLGAYLLGWVFWTGITAGCLLFVLVHHLTGGRWGLPVRRFFEAGALNALPMALLFVPVALALDTLYPWAGDAELPAHLEHLVHHRAPYLNAGFFLGRTAFYLALWGLVAFLFARWSREKERLHALAGPALLFSFLIATFAAVDWVMSLELLWFSTAFGLVWTVSAALGALCAGVAVATRALGYAELPREKAEVGYRDLMRLLLATTMLWGYVAFAEYMIVWSGNLPEVTPHYIRRNEEIWRVVTLALVVVHFALALVLLVARGPVLARLRRLGTLALVLLGAQWLFAFWLVVPAVVQGRPPVPWVELGATAAVGGLWVAAAAGRLRDGPLVPPAEVT